MTEYLIIRKPDPDDELPENVGGWLALNARPLRQIGFFHRAGMHIHPDQWAPELAAAFVADGGILPGPKTMEEAAREIAERHAEALTELQAYDQAKDTE